MSIRERPSTLIGMLLIVVLIGLQSGSGTILSRPGPPVGGYFGGGTGGGGPIATDGFHSGGVGGGSSIVFPGPNDRRSAFFGLLKLPYIICYYAASGKWPAFPPQLHAAILDLGRHVYAMDDYGLRNYCSKYFRVTVAHRPCCAAPVIRPGLNPGYSFDEVPGIAKPTRKRPQKKATPAPGEIDTEVVTGIETEGDAEEQPPEYPDEEPEEEPAEDYGRLQVPVADGRRKNQPKNGDRCIRGAKGCVSNTVSFIPLRNEKTTSEAADMNKKEPEMIDLKATAKSVVTIGGKVGRNGIPK